VVLLRYVRTAPGEMFLSTTAVVSIEVTKTLGALIFLFCECSFSFSKLGSQINTHIIKNTGDMCKVSIPAILYTIQNNLVYLAISNMNICVFQATFQLKLLTTAACVVFMLNRSLRFTQWVALVILTTGVAVIQIENVKVCVKALFIC
jgi:UDP-sugar transporter A1/2/3